MEEKGGKQRVGQQLEDEFERKVKRKKNCKKKDSVFEKVVCFGKFLCVHLSFSIDISSKVRRTEDVPRP